MKTLKSLVEACLAWRMLVLAMIVVVATLGVKSALKLPIDAVPDITNTQVQVLTNAPALGPVDVERAITVPVEGAMSGIPGIVKVRSVSRFGLSAVTVVFEEGTDLLRARQLVSERLVDAREDLPEGASPELAPMSTGLGEIFQFEVKSDRACEPGADDTDACHSPMELRSILDAFVAFELRSVPGVVEVNSFGGELKTYEVEVLPDRLRALGVPLDQLFEALKENNATAGGGYIVRSGEQLLVRGDARLATLDEIADVLLEMREDGVPIRVRDVARVHLAPMVRQGAVSRDGRGEAVTGIVMMLVGANGREVVDAVKQRIARIEPSLPEGVSIDAFYDRSALVKRTISTVAKNLAEGALFVIAVLFILLGSLRGGLIVALAIPFAMLVAFIGMQALGLSGNLMSLGAIDFGIVVDGSVIVVENAVVHLAAAAHGKSTPPTYRQAARIVLGSTLDIGKAATFGSAIIVIVYIPILTLAGTEGKMFKPMAITVLFALLGAFVASLTFVPVLVATLLRKHKEEREPLVVRAIHRVYAPALRAAIRVPIVVFTIAVAALGGAVVVGARLGAEFIPRLDEGAFSLEAVRLPSISLEESIASSTRLEQLLKTFPEVDTAVSKTGKPEIATDPMGVNQTDLLVTLKPDAHGRSRDELIAAMSEAIEEEIPDTNVGFSQPIEMRMAEINGGTRADVAITIYGDDLATLERVSLELQKVVRKVPGAEDVKGEQLTGLPTLDIVVDRAAASRYGISARDALDAIEALGGHAVGSVYEGQRQYRLQVRVPKSLREDLDQVGDIPIGADGSRLVPLAQIATIQVVDSPATVSREDIRRRTMVEMNVRGRDLASFVKEAKERVAEVKLPSGYVIGWGGTFENLEAATSRLALALPVALGLIFLLLYMAFGELKPALLIYLNVPFAAVGGVFALAVRGMPFSISAAVGFIALFGIAVLNGVVLVTTIRKLQAEGQSSLDAARHGAESRLRAVLMTAMVAALGFIPMAISSGSGAEVQRPLATVVIGGLVTSTLLTLFMLPTAYAFAFKRWKPPSPEDEADSSLTPLSEPEKAPIQ